MTKNAILRSIFGPLAIALSLFFIATNGFSQTVYTVNTTGDTIVPGACANGTAGCSLRGAITAANVGGNANIIFAIPASDPGCGAGGCVISLMSFLPAISASNILIAGPGNDRIIVRSATEADVRVGIFEVSSPGLVTLSGLTIADGGSSTSLMARFGGILKNGSGALNVLRCHIRNNRSTGGNAVGAGIANQSGVLAVVNSTVYGNNASLSGGGGIGNGPNATLNVFLSTIYNNGGDNGGGGIINNGTANITNSTIVANAAPGNKLAGRGGGIFNVQGSVLNIKNTIVAGNSSFGEGPDVFGNFTSLGFNLIGKTDGSTGFNAPTDLTGTIASPLDPALDPAGLQNNGGPTLTVRLLRSSPAIDKATRFGVSGTMTTDQRWDGWPRTRDNLLIPNAVGGDGTDIGAFENPPPARIDFDGDGKTDVSIYRPSNGQWWHQQSSDGQVRAGVFGTSTDRITPGDFTGDGRTDVAFWRPSTGEWFILRSEDNSFFSFPFGSTGDIPTPADYDGDGKTDAAVFRPSTGTWFILRSGGGGVAIVGFGLSSDKPVPADYDGDKKDDIAIYRPSDGRWWYLRSIDNQPRVFQFGTANDRPVQGDFTGDGAADIAFYRPSSGEWFILRSEDSSFFSFPWGQPGALPVPGDYDSDGKQDAAIFQPSNGGWFINGSASGVSIYQFGLSTDTPVPGAFVP